MAHDGKEWLMMVNCGFQAAILFVMGSQLVTIKMIKMLIEERTLEELCYVNDGDQNHSTQRSS